MKELAVLVVLLGLIYAQHTCGGSPNMHDIISGEAVLISQAKNALKMRVPQDTNNITIVHLYGAPREVGLAQGSIVKEEMANPLSNCSSTTSEW